MTKLGTAIIFFAGLAIGGAAVWYLTREREQQIAEEEIRSVKEAYASYVRKLQDLPAQKDRSSEANAKPASRSTEKVSLKEYAKKMRGEEGYTDYSQTVVPKPEHSVDGPYVISPEEFDEMDGYTPVSLLYFEDGVLSDEYGAIVDDVEEIVGDALHHFGDYEEDAVYCRNDQKRCDYEVLKDLRTYEDFRKTLPPNI